METVLTWGLATVVALVVAVILGVVALPVMLLWNSVIPALFGLQTIGFFQALQLSLLAAILIK